MQLTIDRAALARELAIVATCADKRSTLPILGNVRLEAGNGLRLTCTDLELGITSTVECDVKTPGVTTLPAAKLLPLVRLLPDGPIAFKTSENQWTTVTAERSRTRIAGMDAVSFPELPAAPEGFEMHAGVFCRALASVAYAISTEESRFTLNGALLAFQGGKMLSVATDGHRLALAESNAPTAPDGRFLVPRRAIVELAKLRDGISMDTPVNIASDDNHLFFTVGHRTMTARKMTGNFPDYARILPKDMPHTATVDREAFKRALELSRPFTPEGKNVTPSVRLKFSGAGLSVTAASVDAGESEQQVECSYSGPELEMGFNCAYLLDFLGAVSTEKVVVDLRDANSAVEMRPTIDGYRYVAAPMRI